MNVCVIDKAYNEQTKVRRGEQLAARVRSLGHSCNFQKYVCPGEDDTESWTEESKSSCRITAVSADVFLLHASNNNALNFARDLCADKYVIFYSGGSIGTAFVDDCRKHPKHCIAKGEVGDDFGAVTWDLDGCLKAIERDDPDFCQILNRFDPLLEANPTSAVQSDFLVVSEGKAFVCNEGSPPA